MTLNRTGTMAAYEVALCALTPLPRAVFLIHRVEGHGYGEIAARLGLAVELVTQCMSEALYGVRSVMDDPTSMDRGVALIVAAEKLLLGQYRAYCIEITARLLNESEQVRGLWAHV